MIPTGVQKDREDIFPFNRNPKCWYIILFIKDNKINWREIPNSYSGSLITLLCASKAIVSGKLRKKGKAIIFGVWTGKYRTDLFLLNPEKVIIELEKRGITCMREVLEYWRGILGTS